MDPITLIVAALLAGASAGAKDLTSDVMKDSYAAFKGLLSRRFHSAADAAQEDLVRSDSPATKVAIVPDVILEAHESDPETWDRPLRDALSSTGADQDEEILLAAQAVLDAAGVAESLGKYRVDVRGAQGVQVGDHATMTNTFGVNTTERPGSWA